MTEEQATAIAGALGGEAWQSGGDIWLVLIHRLDGHMVVLFQETVLRRLVHDLFRLPVQSIAQLSKAPRKMFSLIASLKGF